MSAKNFQVNGTRNRFGTVTVFRSQDKIEIQLHNTIVVSKTALSVTLNSNGWKTVTTKQCMNYAMRQMFPGYAPFVRQTKGVWYVDMPNGETLPYEDNMVIPLSLLYKLVAS